MNIHITNIEYLGGTAKMAQDGVILAAYEALGAKKISFARRNFYDDYWNTIGHHIDGALAKLTYGDIVIHQYPSHNSPDYDAVFINKVRCYRDVKLIIFVEDLLTLLYNNSPAVRREVEFFNNSDLLILPSVAEYNYLLDNGLRKDIPILYQQIWEMQGYPEFIYHDHIRRICFSGNATRFPFLCEYNGRTMIDHFDGCEPETYNRDSLTWKGFYEPHRLMKELSRGGYGLVWCDKEQFDLYYHMNQPHKLGFNLASGIPVIIREGAAHSDFIREHGLGFVVSSLDEADELVQTTTDKQYQEMIANVAKIQHLSLRGIYTKRLLTEAVITLLENSN